MESLRKWIREDENQTLQERTERAAEVVDICPVPAVGMALFGGEPTHRAFVEARLAYVNGLYLSAILSALAALERHFAGILYTVGLDAAKRMTFESLLKRGQSLGLFGADHAEDFEKFRVIRNSYAHFREPQHELSTMRRAIREQVDIETLLRKDAKEALQILGRYFNTYPYPNVRIYPE